MGEIDFDSALARIWTQSPLPLLARRNGLPLRSQLRAALVITAPQSGGIADLLDIKTKGKAEKIGECEPHAPRLWFRLMQECADLLDISKLSMEFGALRISRCSW
jgi:hypothetical protein